MCTESKDSIQKHSVVSGSAEGSEAGLELLPPNAFLVAKVREGCGDGRLALPRQDSRIDLRVDVAGDGPFADLVTKELQKIFKPTITRRSKAEVRQRWNHVRRGVTHERSNAHVVLFLEWEDVFCEVRTEEEESPEAKLFVLVGPTRGQSWLYLWHPSRSSSRTSGIIASTCGSMQKISDEAWLRCISEMKKEVVRWCNFTTKEESIFILFDEQGAPSRHDELLNSFFDPEEDQEEEYEDDLP